MRVEALLLRSLVIVWQLALIAESVPQNIRRGMGDTI